jgi:hypothetical protein
MGNYPGRESQQINDSTHTKKKNIYNKINSRGVNTVQPVSMISLELLGDAGSITLSRLVQIALLCKSFP